MKSTRHLKALKAHNSVVTKRASLGERVIGSLFPSRGQGYPGTWGADRIEQVFHFRNWQFIGIDTIACKVASIFPNIAWVEVNEDTGTQVRRKGSVRADQRALCNLMHRGFQGEPYVGAELTKRSSWDDPKSTTTWGNYVGTEGWETQAQSPVGFSGGGHSFLTMGEWRGKALSVVKPHEFLSPMEEEARLVRLMHNPNPVDTYFDVEYELQMFEELCGVSYEWTPKNAFGQPCERWCIPSHWVYPRTGSGDYVPFNKEYSDELVWDYEIRPWGYPGYAGVLHFPPDEVIVTRWKNPLSKIDGYSKLMAGAQWIDEEEGISQARWSQMINQGWPGMVVELGPGYEDPDTNMIERISAKFFNKVQGAFNYGRPLFTPPGAKVSPVSFSPNEMAYFQSEEQIRDMILSLLRVPPAAVGLVKEMTYGSIMATLGSLCVFCLNPRLNMRGQNRTKHLASRFDEKTPAYSQSGRGRNVYGSGQIVRRARIWYDDCVPADPQQVNSDLGVDMQAYAVTPNEVRAIRGRAPYERGGNNPIVNGPGGPMPLLLNVEEDIDDIAAAVAQMTQAEGTETGQQQQQDVGTEAQARIESSDVRAEATEDGQTEVTTPDGGELEGPQQEDEGTGLVPPERPNGKPSKQFRKWCKKWTRKDAGPHEFSSTQFNLEGGALATVQGLIAQIDGADLAANGKEDVPHITVKYGLHGTNPGPVRQLVEKFGPVTVRLGYFDVFKSDEYDVVVIGVRGERLHELNSLLATLPHTDTHPEYRPHVTLAYVKPGKGNEYVELFTRQSEDEQGIPFDEPIEFTLLVFSPKNGTPTGIEIASFAWAEKRPRIGALGRLGRKKLIRPAKASRRSVAQLRQELLDLPPEVKDGMSVWYNEGPPRLVIVDLADWWGQDMKRGEAVNWESEIKSICSNWCGDEQNVIFHNEQGTPDKDAGWRAIDLHNVTRFAHCQVQKSNSGRGTLAVDLDGTICEYDGWKGEDHFGQVREGATQALQQLEDDGWEIVIWTTRGNKDKVHEFLTENMVPFHHINENPDQPEGTSPKIVADIYIDDRALSAKKPWDQILEDVQSQTISIDKQWDSMEDGGQGHFEDEEELPDVVDKEEPTEVTEERG